MNNFNIENNRIYYDNRNIDSVEHFLSLLNDIIFNKNREGNLTHYWLRPL